MLDATAPFDRPPPVFSVVIPAFNEADGIAAFHRRLAETMGALGVWEAIYVNDGSTDTTLATLQALRRANSHIAVVNLSRNFGKEIATTAGLDHARGDSGDRDRRRPAGPARGDPAACRHLARGVRHGLCAPPRAARARPG